MEQTYNIEHLVDIKVPSSVVFGALTTAEGLAEVWTGELSVEPIVGFVNEFRFGSAVDRMKITTLEKDKRIVWEVIDSDPEWVGTVISFDLRENKGQTIVTLKQEKWRAVTDMFRSCNYHWGFFLYSLKSYCEDGKGIPYQARTF
ncbi:activator of HSP90 ATPase [Parapedobacter pyrenivorans]|uniref:Activator of HSP90 ATPase n=1 Tax=Parapedobacter pyrenivorans TaxID=1305674 RepID=A0A917MBP1_9SPHI|nr:SRPBCC domain-containing protein [Parapedobacter pyrenivorans]GGG92550.1 activator of HSP90 ATPase [Parapedobacter pyrenivorans]